MATLVLWEVSKKQQYIFSSNKLQENRGASIIIEDIIEKIPYDFEENYRDDLIYNGGGSSLYKFNNTARAKQFIKNISEKAIKDLPGIELFMVTEEYNEAKDRITEAIDNAYKKLEIKKNRRKNSGGQLSFGIERLCEATGLPASSTEKDDDGIRYISREIEIKKRSSSKNSKKFEHLLPEEVSPIKDFNDLTKGEKNYIAVVHIDGNQMGVKLQMLKEGFEYGKNNIKETNEEYLRALIQFSDYIKNAYENSFKHMTDKIQKNREDLKEITKIDEGKFPVIPIIIAGDDITYVANGKIGIESAKLFIECLNTYKLNINGESVPLNACAGIAIARVGHQFYKAYELAEDLCSNAKKKVLKDYENTGKDYSLIDWHIEQGDIIGTVSEIREKHYEATDGKVLNMRPLYINNREKWTNYDNFKKAYYYITERKIARNKIKKLRDMLRKGEKETELYILSNQLYFYFPSLEGTRGDYCYFDNQCMYYDAIEAIDLFTQLKQEGDICRTIKYG